MSQALYRLENVHKKYYQGGEEVPVLNNVNIEISKGECIGIMGPSGSGKTTLLNIIGGIDSIDSGNVIYDGKSICGLTQSELASWRSNNVAFVFQAYNLVSTLNAEKNVALPLMLTSLSKKENEIRVNSALDLVGLLGRAKHLPSELSGGQQQRVAIARALVADAPVLLCDEPTGNLDRKATNEIMEILKLLNEKYKKTIVIVTHDLDVTSILSRRIDLLEAD